MSITNEVVMALLERAFPGENPLVEEILPASDFEGLEGLGQAEVIEVGGVALAPLGQAARLVFGFEGEQVALEYAESQELELGRDLAVETWKPLVVISTGEVIQWDLQTHRLRCVERSTRRWTQAVAGGFWSHGDRYHLWEDQYGELEGVREGHRPDEDESNRVRSGLHYALLRDI